MSQSRAVEGQSHAYQIHYQRLRMFCEQVGESSLAYGAWIIALLAILWIAGSDRIGMMVWLSLTAAIEFVKIKAVRLFLKLDVEQQNLSAWEWRIAAYMFSQGVIVSAGVMLLLDMQAVNAMFTTFFLLCVSAYTSAMFQVTSLRAYYAWATALLVPPAVKLFASDNEYYWLFAAILLLGSVIYIPISAKLLHKYMIETLRLRFENLDLLNSAEQEKRNADRASADKTRFLTSASHDLRQPMQAMSLYLEVLKYREDEPGKLKIIESLCDSHSSAGRIMDSLLDISKLDEGLMEAHLEAISLDIMIENLIRDYALAADKKGIELRKEQIGVMVSSDLVMLECILNNLVSNAIRYTEKGGNILISCSRDKDRVVLEVRDSGIGIAPEKLEDIFSEFYQLNNPERDKSKGLGLGLSIVDRLIGLLPDHQIKVTSKFGHGSCFAITMPEEACAIALGNRDLEEAERYVDFKGLRVFIIEDNRSVRKAMESLLQAWGCVIESVENAEESVRLVKGGWVPNVIVSDYRLPGDLTGVEAIEMIRGLVDKQVHGMIISGETQSEIVQVVEDAGLQLLHKPIDAVRLEKLLQEYSLK